MPGFWCVTFIAGNAFLPGVESAEGPSLVPDDGMAWFGAVQIGVALGFLGAFALVYLVFSRVFPTLPLPDRS